MIVNTKSILDKAYKEHYGIIAPNVCNELTARAAIKAAEENNAPIILDLVLDCNPNIVLLTKMIKEMAKNISIPIAINLDYCSSYDDAMFALKNGFTSVSLDCSDKTLAQGIKETSEIVETAHALNASVEGQLGIVRRSNDLIDHNDLTNIDEVLTFIKKTKVDTLSVSIGNLRGRYQKQPDLDLNLLKKINKIAKIPLSLHGCSYLEDGLLIELTKNGVAKINMSTLLYDYANNYLLSNQNSIERPYEVFDIYSIAYKNIISKYIKLLNQNEKY